MLHVFLATLVAIGLWASYEERDWFWDPYTYHLSFVGNQVPYTSFICTLYYQFVRARWRIRWYYLLEITHYSFGIVHIFFEPALKDRKQMFAHHVITLILQISSYIGNTVRYGVAIMLLHDVSDPLMELAKLCLYSGLRRVSDKFFLLLPSNLVILSC